MHNYPSLKRTTAILILLLALMVWSDNVQCCPTLCQCQRKAVSCRGAGLTVIPRSIPQDIERLDFSNNSLTSITITDFMAFNRLKTLNLSSNAIKEIQPGSFDKLIVLEKLLLAGNKLHEIQDKVFNKLKSLKRLDLVNNQILDLAPNSFSGLSKLKSLRLDHNFIDCVPATSLSGLKSLLILHLKVNPLSCNCHLNWLADLKNSQPKLRVFGKCRTKLAINGKKTFPLGKNFTCTESERHMNLTCSYIPACPQKCTCIGTIVDCSRKKLTEIPHHLPMETTDLRISGNRISSIKSFSLRNLKKLAKIDLSTNLIEDIHPEAFKHTPSLEQLLLFNNKLKHLPTKVFNGLFDLRDLILDGNYISCIDKETFQDQQKLKILSISRNKLSSLVYETIDPSKRLLNIQSILLSENPFICDCNLQWLNHQLIHNSTMRQLIRGTLICNAPRRMVGNEIGLTSSSQFMCKGSEGLRTSKAGSQNCFIDWPCPNSCTCSGSKVTCKGKKFTEIPDKIPRLTTELRLDNNEISEITAGKLDELKYLEFLSVSKNKVTKIADGVFKDLQNLKHLFLTRNKIKCLNEDTFQYLPNLQYLFLPENQIVNIEEGTFSYFKSLNVLRLAENPLVCDCYLKWLAEWLRKQNVKADSVQCFKPDNFHGYEIDNMKASSFQCLGKRKDRCEAVNHCPDGCSCYGTEVDCNRRGLTTVPSLIPTDTTQLDLSHNNITVIPDFAFKNLARLQYLFLFNNQITTIKENIFDDLVSLVKISLEDNSLYCDCNITWLREYLLQKNVVSSGVKCKGPLKLRNQFLKRLNEGQLVCNEDSTAVQHTCNPCLAKPCANNGVCFNQGNGRYRCKCPKGYKGTQCEQKIVTCSRAINCGPNTDYCFEDADRFQYCKCLKGFIGDRCDTKDKCYSNPCQNNGKCTYIHSDFLCRCEAGFTGSLCQTKLESCHGYCKNGGSCQYNFKGDRFCNCFADFTGPICQHSIQDYCSLADRPCANGGVCTNNLKAQNYTCSCPYGFTGPRCELIDERCIGNNCTNGATCTSSTVNTGYLCLCPYGFAGKYCDICVKCQNGGKCVTNETGSHLCVCPDGFTGDECQNIHKVSFISTNSYIKMPGPSIDEVLTSASTISLSMKFSTYTSSGLVAYDGGMDDFISVEVVNGKIVVTSTLWGYPTRIQSEQSVNDGVKHSLTISIARKQLTAVIDNIYMYTTELFPSKAEIDFASGFFLGGIPVGLKHLAGTQNQILSGYGFVGCINDVVINNTMQYFHLNRNLKENRDIMIGCTIRNTPFTSSYDPCVDNPCPKESYCVKFEGSGNITRTCLENCYRKTGVGHVYLDGCVSTKKVRYSTCMSQNESPSQSCFSDAAIDPKPVFYRCGTRSDVKLKVAAKAQLCNCKTCNIRE
ncbi:uncharacterized protein TRIADDRAFT_58750 [Trichoplax adhaerens]|uniref:Uncharacterized protein n=1 Tax=Trichoplax adhaerens TaxID=10228 RepID=B3S3J9_TRIAD|nr:hypothetical protein TRIADDRAFT_58750 [Trichoplax adhaerens]EDV22809.1 hypothetical protein TRIADDRAFT_58750 [Trichoplax adhaerens]|eukprot:XP_002114675.1 hypothetical protein TRIADDRAFT_58750 [Trichoplax adhaerens]